MAYDNKKLKQNEFNEIVPQAYSPAIDDYEAVQSTHGGLHNVLYGPNGLPLSVVNNKLAVRATELEALMQGFSTDGKLEQVRQEIENSRNELALVKSELETIKANQISGDQKVQLSGTTVEVHQETFSGTIDGSATFPNNIFDLVNTQYATIIDRVHIKSRNVNLQINVSFRKKDGTRIDCRSPATGTFTSTIDVAPIAVYNLKSSKFFQVDLFDEENDIYILSLREPLYFPFGGAIRLTTSSTESCQVGAVANYREVTT